MELGNVCSKNDSWMWEWQGKERSLQTGTQNEFSHLFWDQLNGDGDELLYTLHEHTPIKDCADVGNQISNFKDDATKGLEYKESMQLKRRRTLQFTTDVTEAANEQLPSAFLDTKMMECPMVEDGISETLECTAQWASCFPDDGWWSDFTSEVLDQSSDGWLLECLNESEMHCSRDETHSIVGFNQQVGISEASHDSPAMEIDMMPQTHARSQLKVFKGKMSYMRSSRKLTTSVAYPFVHIKPSGVEGDVTLNDINQRLHAPPPSKLNHKNGDDPSLAYPTSAFSGKPVVLRTKIRTEGGQGSITILRTKG